MSYFRSFLSGPAAEALGWTLLHAIWQGFALVLPVALALHLLRNQSSALRYRVSVLTLLGQLLLSAITFAWYYQPAINSSVRASHLSFVRPARTTVVDWPALTHTLPWYQQVQQFLEAHLNQFVLVYLIGVALFGVRLAGGWVYLQHLSQSATQPTSAVWGRLTEKLQAMLPARTTVQIRESVQITVPMVIGVIKPLLLVPVGLATHLSVHELEVILAHELAHVKRHDYGVNLLQSVTEVLYFFHPALWWLSARVREEREHCCDDLAVQACGGDGRVLAQALAHVEELRLIQISQIPALAMGFASQRQHLLHRVRRMLGVPTRPFVSNSSLAGLTLATILVMSLSVYGVQQQPKPTKKQPHKVVYEPSRNDAEFSVSDNKRIDYIIWKGKRLPAMRLAGLQHQFDQIMSGQLSLDEVNQPDRAILLTVVNTTKSYTDAAANGFPSINHDNIVASALTTAASGSDDLAENAKTSYDSLIYGAAASYEKAQALFDSLPRQNLATDHFQDILRNQDSLAEQRALNQEKLASLEVQAQSQRFAVEAVERKFERFERQQAMLEQKRFYETSAQQQAILKSGVARTDSARSSLLKQIEAREQSIQAIESAIDKLNQQMMGIQAELENAQKPLRQIEAQMRKLTDLDRLSYLTYAESGVVIPRLARPAKAPVSAKAAMAPYPAIPALKSRPSPRPAPASRGAVPALPARP